MYTLRQDTEDGQCDLDAGEHDAYWVEGALQSSEHAPACQKCEQHCVEADTHKAQSSTQVMQKHQFCWLQEEQKKHKDTII